MLSDSCSFEEFIENVQADDLMELMYLTEKEATEAERRLFRPRVSPLCKEKCGIHYAETLKNFLFYMRYGIRPAGISDEIFKAYRRACDGLGYPGVFGN